MASFGDILNIGVSVLHLDWLDYAEQLLGDGHADWGSAATVAGLIGKAQTLLPSDLVLVPLDRLIAARVTDDPRLRAAVGSKMRGDDIVRIALADMSLRSECVDAVEQSRAQVRNAAVGIILPSPTALVSLVAAAARLHAPPIDEDTIDDVAVLTADFVRTFATSPVELLVLGGPTDTDRDFLAPVVRSADHYGWSIGTMDVDGILAPLVGTWSGLRSVKVEPGANPEATLATVSALRGQLA